MDVGPQGLKLKIQAASVSGTAWLRKNLGMGISLALFRADTLDTGYNRIRVSAQQAINSTDPKKHNPFIGGDPGIQTAEPLPTMRPTS